MVDARLRLEEVIRGYGKTAVAFSGGVDSAVVLKIARLTLGKANTLAVTADSPSVSRRELESAKRFAIEHDIEHVVLKTEELDDQNYQANTKERCYFCKLELYEKTIQFAKQEGIHSVCSGTNQDDLSDFRPGLKAAAERSIRHPLIEAGLKKADVRRLAKHLQLSTWDKPASPCLASRLPYGSKVTEEKLSTIETAENFLKDLGFRELRVRHMDQKARIELGSSEFIQIMDVGLRKKITDFVLSLGFKHVYFDAFKSGNLNTENAKG